MPRYIIERNVPGLTREQLQAAGRKSNQVIAGMPGIVWIKSYVSEAEGKIYCEYEAPNPEMVLEHARRTGIPADKISEVALEINPEMFR
jgi:Nickel responsive protein SCO4226-like